MKRQFLVTIVTALFSIIGYSQQGNAVSWDELWTTLSVSNVKSLGADVQGSPYLDKKFSVAKVGEIDNAFLRYNAFNDEFEFINSKNDTLVLNKTEAFSDIIFTIWKLNYQLLSYTEKSGKSNTGYLVKLYEKSNYVLYKRQRVTFSEARKPSSSYDNGAPARFSEVTESFYLKNNNNEITELPTNKKGIIKMFPERKVELEAFFKQNSIDLDKEKELPKLIDFLAG